MCGIIRYNNVNRKDTRKQPHYYVYVLSPETGMGQSSSVMLDQKTQIMMTDKRVKRVSKSAPSILPLVP